MGLEFGADHGDPLTVHELSTVLDHLPFKLDILGCNACDMASAEGVYELRNSAQYLVAWENTVPYRGWPYTQILNRLAAGEVLTADQLGRDIVRQSAETSVKLTMFDLAQAEGLGEKVKDLAAALTDAKAAESKGILKAFSSAAQTDFAPLIDLVDLCNKLRRDVADAAARPLSDAAGKIVAFLIPGNDGFILENSHDRKLNGVGIFAPSRMTQSQDDVDEMLRREKPYKNLRLMTEQMEEQNTSWASFVYGLMDRVLDGHSDQETPVKSPAKK
jgi:hypothetical protein